MSTKSILSGIFYFVFVLFMSFDSLGQSRQENSSTPVYFAEGYFEMNDEQNIDELKALVAANENVDQYRLDLEDHLFIVITKNVEEFDESMLMDWFGGYITDLHCTHIGVQGVDARNSYPYQNCQD